MVLGVMPYTALASPSTGGRHGVRFLRALPAVRGARRGAAEAPGQSRVTPDTCATGATGLDQPQAKAPAWRCTIGCNRGNYPNR